MLDLKAINRLAKEWAKPQLEAFDAHNEAIRRVLFRRKPMLDLEAIKRRAEEAAKRTNPAHHVDALLDSQQDVLALLAEVERLRGVVEEMAAEALQERLRLRADNTALAAYLQIARGAGLRGPPLDADFWEKCRLLIFGGAEALERGSLEVPSG
jgi:hypothetical protein